MFHVGLYVKLGLLAGAFCHASRQIDSQKWHCRNVNPNPNPNVKVQHQNDTYTKVTAFLVFKHFLLMKIKMPSTAQTRQRLPTRQVTISGGSTGMDTSSLQRSPWQCQYLPTGHLKEMRTKMLARERHTRKFTHFVFQASNDDFDKSICTHI